MEERIAPECGCTTTGYVTRGMCKMHYDRWVQKTPKGQRGPSPSAARRFWDYVDKSGDCWVWTGPTIRNGYGFWSGLLSDGRQGLAHRLSLAEVTPCPDESLLACHHCDNPPCVNPGHLYWGTKKDNARDLVERHGAPGKGIFLEVCKRGHAMEGDNIVYAGQRKSRRCRECDRIRGRESEARKRRAKGIPAARYWRHVTQDEIDRALVQVAAGASMREVALELRLAVPTVQQHLSRVDGYADARAAARGAA